MTAGDAAAGGWATLGASAGAGVGVAGGSAAWGATGTTVTGLRSGASGALFAVAGAAVPDADGPGTGSTGPTLAQPAATASKPIRAARAVARTAPFGFCIEAVL
jgi:hypothetical protein